MLEVAKKSEKNVLKIYLKGRIDYSVDFDKLFGPCPGTIQVNCRFVEAITSHGVNSWIRYFQVQAKKGTKLSFAELSPAMMRTLAMISNLLCGGKIQSVIAPYTCAQCGHDYSVRFSEKDILDFGQTPPEMECPKCKKKGQFDDIAEEYFSYFKRP